MFEDSPRRQAQVTEVLRRILAPVRTVTSSGSITLVDGPSLVDATTAAVVLVLPDPVIARGCRFVVKKLDVTANTVTLSAADIDGASTYVLTTQYEAVEVLSDGTSYHVIGTY